MNNIMSSTYYVKVDEDGTDALLPEIENAGTFLVNVANEPKICFEQFKDDIKEGHQFH